MRSTGFLAIAAAAFGLSISQPATAWDDSYVSGTVYVHHHYYAPLRYKHLYHLHKPGPRHIHVVHGPCGYRHRDAGGCFAPWGYRHAYYYRRFW